MKKIIPFIMALIILTGCNKADINDSDIKQATKAESSESAVTLLIKSFVENDKELFQSLYTGETLSFEGLKEKFIIKVNKDDGYYYFTGIIPKSGF